MNSRPSPLITAAPWISASLATLVGMPNDLVSSVLRSKCDHSSSRRPSTSLPGPSLVEKCGAESTRPALTIPGKPTDARSALGNGATSLPNDATSLSGGSG